MSPRKQDPDAETARVSVRIFGQSYTLRTDDDPAYIESLAGFLDGRMREIADRTRTADTVKIAILAALNVADELHRTRPGGEGGARGIDEWAGRIEAILDGALQESEA